jgi:hypothetical protein
MSKSTKVLLALCAGLPLMAQAPSLLSTSAWALPATEAGLSSAAVDEHQAHHEAIPDLGLANFFTAGWDQPWEHRHDRYTPDMALLKVTTNALEKELRLDYTDTSVRGNAKVDTSQVGSALIAFAINRRLMVEVINNAQWNLDFHNTTTSGSGGGGVLRLQLADTQTSCTSFQVKAAVPNKGLGQTQTTLSYALASWQDLHALLPGLGQTGLYESIQYDKLEGPAKAGAKTKGSAADITLAKTWTDASSSPFGRFTTFGEFYASRDLDGPNTGQTVASFTPGIRTWFSKNNSLMLGEDLPLGHRANFYRVTRLTYIFNF